MRTSLQQLFLAPTLIICGFAMLFVFQNCSGDIAFDTQPSQFRPFENDSHGNGFFIGGDGDVIIGFHESPGDRTFDDGEGLIDFEVRLPDGHPPQSVRCVLNGKPVDCGSKGQVVAPNQELGMQTFLIEVTTNSGRVVSETLTWQVYERIVERSKNFTVKSKVSDKVDIIIVVDNSGSMEYEQRSMAGRMANFMAAFKGLDYHIAITTTSPIGNEEIWKASLNYVDGKFLPLDEHQNHCLRRETHPDLKAQQLLQAHVVRDLYLRDDSGEIIQNPETLEPYPEGNGWERGIYMTYRSFERSQKPSPESNCLRQGVDKHVVLISDERETLTDNEGQPLPEIEKSSGRELMDFVAQVFPGVLFKFHSIIVNPLSSEGEACLATHGNKPGVEYARLSQDTGGVIGSVCAEDYAEPLGRIGEGVRDSHLSHPLSCVVVQEEGLSPGEVFDRSTGEAILTPFLFRGDKLELQEPLPPGDYRVTYKCYE